MIYSGYSGIGKTSITKRSNKYIDLESSLFRINGFHLNNWDIVYCNIADYLSKQGYDVFISTHKEVRDRLRYCGIPFLVITPTLELKDQWVAKLKQRYEENPTQSNYLAFNTAFNLYDKLVGELLEEPNKLIIDNMDYDLETLIQNHNYK